MRIRKQKNYVVLPQRVLLTTLQRDSGNVNIIRADPRAITAKEITDMADVDSRAFRRGVYEYFVKSQMRRSTAVFFAINAEPGKVVGFAITKPPILKSGERIKFHRDAIDPAFQDQGIYREISRLRAMHAIETGKLTMMVYTKNPIVEHSINASLQELQERGLIAGYEMTAVRHQYRAADLTFRIRR